MKTIKTTTKDNLIYTGQLFESDNKENIIIHIHGMAGDIYTNSFYPPMQEIYPKNGWSFLAVEHRGTHAITFFNTTDGNYKCIGDAYEIFEDSVYDIQAWIDKARELGYRKIWLQSHSLAPSKVAYYISQTKNHGIEGLIFLSPADMTNFSEEERPQHEGYIVEAEQMVKEGKGDDLIPGNLFGWMKICAKSYVNFFGKNSKADIFNYLKKDNWEVINKIDIPVIAFTGTDDYAIVPIIDPYEGMQILEKQLINSPRKKTVVYKDSNHDFKGFGEEITKEVLDFIN